MTLSFTARVAPTSRSGERGAVFDSSPQNKPMRFVAGADDVMPGWAHGVIGTCLGERRRLTIPPEWAFAGRRGLPVPGDATVEITLDLIAVEEPPNLFAAIDANKNNVIDHAELVRWLRSEGVPAGEAEVVARELIKQDDKNGDGLIQWAEYSGPRGRARPRETRTMRALRSGEDDDEDYEEEEGGDAVEVDGEDDEDEEEVADARIPSADALRRSHPSSPITNGRIALDETRFSLIARERDRLFDSAPADLEDRLADMGIAPLPEWLPEFDDFLASAGGSMSTEEIQLQ